MKESIRPEKKTAKSKQSKPKESSGQNANPYDNLFAIFSVLREHATQENPLSASQIHAILEKESQEFMCENTIKSICTEHPEKFEEFWGQALCVSSQRNQKPIPAQTTVKEVLAKQYDQSTLVAGKENLPQVACFGKKGTKFEDYHKVCEATARKQGMEELPLGTRGPNRYYYLKNPLTQGEWGILSDLLLFSPWISALQTQKFMNVLHYYGGRKYVNLEGHYQFKRENAQQFTLIHTLHQGISQRKQVRIEYGTHVLQLIDNVLKPTLQLRSKNNPMVVCPLSLVWANGLYYLVARYEETGTMHLRVDRIITAHVINKNFDFPTDFSAAQHRDSSPIMYGGERILVKFTCPAHFLNTVMDFFGASPQYSQKDEQITVTVRVSDAGMKLFALQYIEQVEILDPPALREEIRGILEKNQKKYTDK